MVVGEDDVGFEIRKRALEVALGVDALRDQIEAAFAELAGDQLGVLRAVFDHQYSDFHCHFSPRCNTARDT